MYINFAGISIKLTKALEGFTINVQFAGGFTIY